MFEHTKSDWTHTNKSVHRHFSNEEKLAVKPNNQRTVLESSDIGSNPRRYTTKNLTTYQKMASRIKFQHDDQIRYTSKHKETLIAPDAPPAGKPLKRQPKLQITHTGSQDAKFYQSETQRSMAYQPIREASSRSKEIKAKLKANNLDLTTTNKTYFETTQKKSYCQRTPSDLTGKRAGITTTQSTDYDITNAARKKIYKPEKPKQRYVVRKCNENHFDNWGDYNILTGKATKEFNTKPHPRVKRSDSNKVLLDAIKSPKRAKQFYQKPAGKRSRMPCFRTGTEQGSIR